MTVVDLRFVRYGIGIGVANIELVLVYNEVGSSDTVHWIYPQPNRENGTSDMEMYRNSTWAVSKEKLNSKAYQTVYDRDVASLRIAVDSKPDNLTATVRAIEQTAQQHMSRKISHATKVYSPDLVACLCVGRRWRTCSISTK